MAERKVFNKYIPPDFDPRLLPKGERPPNNQLKLRNMLPMTVCCTTCGEYMGRGTKFNSRQEIAQGMDWKGIKRWRFYVKCSSCSSEMTFLTDPENDHYVPEHGCSSMTEPWRAKIEAEEAYIKRREDEELGDAMKALENRSKETKYQLDVMDTINDLQDINKQHRSMDMDKVIKVLYDKKNSSGTIISNDQEESEEKLVNEYKFHQSKRRKLNNGNVEISLTIGKTDQNGDSVETADTTDNINTEATNDTQNSDTIDTKVSHVFRFGAKTPSNEKTDKEKNDPKTEKIVDNLNGIVIKKRKKAKKIKTETKETDEKKQT
ncbi:hypothetical protein RFI_24357 [Reticulomyxa filosa]|uniref:Splicing factor YJU2 n=1 Tax=Reticulomyxa filosa TaxID=46433 RepID=X6MIX7_RETFI|nr:hypothetical protein RFI_24357 [Reticulomyxa filosa]|eukprot:ETO13020.1 hypothetical protein RFI_24357 [Reticulomyxa filosa]